MADSLPLVPYSLPLALLILTELTQYDKGFRSRFIESQLIQHQLASADLRAPQSGYAGTTVKRTQHGHSWQRRGSAGRDLEGDHRAAATGRPALVRGDRQGGRALRGGRTAAGAAIYRRRRDADRGRDRSAPVGLP